MAYQHGDGSGGGMGSGWDGEVPQEILDIRAEMDAIITSWGLRIDKQVIDALEKCVVIGVGSVGVDMVDIAAAGDRLVAVGERGHILYSDDDGKSWTTAFDGLYKKKG